jgi:hypothetical protein
MKSPDVNIPPGTLGESGLTGSTAFEAGPFQNQRTDR